MSELRLLAWNVRTGNDLARSALRSLLAIHKPHVTALSEAYSLRLGDKHGKFAGCDVLQESPAPGRKSPWFHEPVSEYGEQAVLIAPGVDVLHDRVVPMTKEWTGPVNGLKHEPRRNRRLRVAVDREIWPFSFEHWATGWLDGNNGPAVREAIKEAHTYLGRDGDRCIVGDLNAGTKVLAKEFDGCTVVGSGPDNLIGCGVKVKREVLGKFGSDHPAILYTLKKEN